MPDPRKPEELSEEPIGPDSDGSELFADIKFCHGFIDAQSRSYSALRAKLDRTEGVVEAAKDFLDNHLWRYCLEYSMDSGLDGERSQPDDRLRAALAALDTDDGEA